MPGEAFADKIMLITGAASGIGHELARTLARLGAAVVLGDRDEAGLERVVAELAAGGGRSARGRGVDVADAQAVAGWVEWACGQAGRVDGLINCAGIYPVTPLLEITPAEWERVLRTNLSGPFLVTQAVARHMIAQGAGGAVVNISSTASRLARPGIAHYGASKAGLNQLTSVMAIELAPHDIRVNAILPGLIGTERVLAGIRGGALPPGEHEAKLARIPLGRMGTAEEVVNLALFLLSPQASYCTGGLYTVDGGFTLGIPRY